MKWRMLFAALLASAASLLTIAAHAQTLFAATGSNGIAGSLYTVNPATAATTLVGPLLAGALPVGLTGLARHPVSGVLYGATAVSSPNFARSLVTVNPATAAVTVIGSFGAGINISDISFNAAGTTLFGWIANTGAIATINIATGAATSIGASGLAGVPGGGGALALNAGNTAFVSASGSAGRLDTVSTATGAGAAGPALTGAPLAGAINAMAFNSGGILFGVNSNQGGPATTRLVTINTTTGAITNIGALPTDTDALAFAIVAAVGFGAPTPAPTMSEWALILLALLIGFVGLRAASRRV